MMPLDGIEIRVDQHMAGCKKAVRFGDGPLIISPAMHALMVGATEEELKHLLAKLSALDRCLGTVPHRNAIVWEVRAY